MVVMEPAGLYRSGVVHDDASQHTMTTGVAALGNRPRRGGRAVLLRRPPWLDNNPLVVGREVVPHPSLTRAMSTGVWSTGTAMVSSSSSSSSCSTSDVDDAPVGVVSAEEETWRVFSLQDFNVHERGEDDNDDDDGSEENDPELNNDENPVQWTEFIPLHRCSERGRNNEPINLIPE